MLAISLHAPAQAQAVIGSGSSSSSAVTVNTDVLDSLSAGSTPRVQPPARGAPESPAPRPPISPGSGAVTVFSSQNGVYIDGGGGRRLFPPLQRPRSRLLVAPADGSQAPQTSQAAPAASPTASVGQAEQGTVVISSGGTTVLGDGQSSESPPLPPVKAAENGADKPLSEDAKAAAVPPTLAGATEPESAPEREEIAKAPAPAPEAEPVEPQPANDEPPGEKTSEAPEQAMQATPETPSPSEAEPQPAPERREPAAAPETVAVKPDEPELPEKVEEPKPSATDKVAEEEPASRPSPSEEPVIAPESDAAAKANAEAETKPETATVEATGPDAVEESASETPEVETEAAASEPEAATGSEETQTASLPPAETAGLEDGGIRLEFGEGSAELTSDAKTMLQELAEMMRRDSEMRVQLMAYAAGDQSTASRSRRLSLSRALAVRSFLIDEGIRSTRMDVRALGFRTQGEPADRVDVTPKHR